MEPYRFPMFVSLRGKKALIAGGGAVAQRRARVLVQFGAQVTLIAPRSLPLPREVTWLPRAYAPGDLEGAFLAVAATDCREVNRQVGQDAAAAGIFVSVADSPEESTFFFPAVCLGDGLVAGLVSDGTDHRKVAEKAREIRTLWEEKP